jgi:MFS family permease
MVLICGRVVQGLGSGGLTPTGMVILGDVAPPRERGRYYGYFSVMYVSAGGIGPALGGFFAEYLHWSMIFWFNIPMGLTAMVLAAWLLRGLPRREKRHRLDFGGAALIMTASVAFMLAISMGGVRYGWTSPPILGMFAVALAIGAGFVARLMTAPEPLIPLSVLAHPVARGAILLNAFGWGPIVGLNIFLPMYLQTVIGLSATYAGLSVLVLSVALNISAGVNGTLLPRLRHYKTIPMILMVVAIAAVLILAWKAQELTHLQFELVLAAIGIGFGGLPPLASTVLQNSVPIHQFGSAVGTMQFTRNLFCTMLVAVFGAVILAGAPVPDAAQIEAGRKLLTDVSPDGFIRVFYVAAASFVVALVAMIWLEERPLQTIHT